MCQDRNFDDLADRFRRNVYGSLKGRIRLSVLERDFREIIPEYFCNSRHKSVLDVAAGEARFSSKLATFGCDLVVNDLSERMLEQAREVVKQHAALEGDQYAARVKFVNCAVQSLSKRLLERQLPVQYDLILCHALIEWMAQPASLAQYLRSFSRPGTYLSLTCYNINGLAFKNLLRTNFHKFDIDNFKPFRGSLTPTHPQDPLQVEKQLRDQGFSIVCKSGIRVFHDYILNIEDRTRDEEGLVEKELLYSRKESFWQVARYVHFLCRYE